MALTAIHLNEVNATAPTTTHRTEWLSHARSVMIGLLVGATMLIAAPFALHAVAVRPIVNSELTSVVTKGSIHFPAVVSTRSPRSESRLAPMGTVTP